MIKKAIIVDDNKEFREALKFLLLTIKGVEIIAEAENGVEFLELLDQYSPDVVFMDIEMPEMNGFKATKIANAKYPNLKIIGLSIHEEFQSMHDLILAGAQNLICKNKLSKELLGKAIFGNHYMFLIWMPMKENDQFGS